MSKKRSPEEAVKDYLERQNRPYSAIDIFNNLHKEFGKTAVVKALETLAGQKKIIEKIYGKQKVYAPLQDQYGEFNEKEIKSLDLKITELNENLASLQQQSKQQESQINSFGKEMTTTELLQAVENLKKENFELNGRIDKLKSGTTLMTKEQRHKLYQRKEKMEGHWKKRKRMANDIINSILEGYPKPKKQLIEETGVETDEEVGVLFPK